MKLISVADFFSVTLSPVYCGLFDEYSRLLPPVAGALFDGAIRLLSLRRVFSRKRRRLLSGVSLRKIDGIGFDCRRSSFEIIDPVCNLINREYGSFVNCFFIGMALLDGGVPSSLFPNRQWKVVCSLLDACLRTPGVCPRGGTRGCLSLWVSLPLGFRPKVSLCLGSFVGPLFVCFCRVWFSWVSLGVIEVCVEFVVIVDLSMDEISILFRLISLTRTIEEVVPNNLPIQSLEVIAVVLVKVRGEFGVVVLFLACFGEARGCFPSSPTLTSRLGRVRWRCLVV
ncbi:hypothetical protein Bca52824_040341 [Brassica carinata]|uniref:Uncharacterized protein n=1 Tax=Brassica carinata TaxID=52824 RepID=A0A8X7UWP6_BRACI|nr:hypothetical protein Bca52824_040341 [Brassica carinata]